MCMCKYFLIVISSPTSPVIPFTNEVQSWAFISLAYKHCYPNYCAHNKVNIKIFVASSY